MASSSLTFFSSLLLLLLTFLGSGPQLGAAITIHEILPQFGIPSGVIPDSVKSYTFNPEDGRFEVELQDHPCYVQLDKYLLSYDPQLTGTLKLGSITDLQGVRMKRALVFWFDVDEIKVDLPPNRLIYFQVGILNKKLDLDLFHKLHSCSPRDRLLAKAWFPPSLE